MAAAQKRPAGKSTRSAAGARQTRSRAPATPSRRAARPQRPFPKEYSREHWAALEALLSSEPRVQAGKMFGFPAFYTGGRLLACAVEEGIALKLPEPMSQALIDDGRAAAFRPLDTFAMRSWIVLGCPPEELAGHHDLLAAAIDYVAAEAQVAPGGRRRAASEKPTARQPKSRRQPKSGRRG